MINIKEAKSNLQSAERKLSNLKGELKQFSWITIFIWALFMASLIGNAIAFSINPLNETAQILMYVWGGLAVIAVIVYAIGLTKKTNKVSIAELEVTEYRTKLDEAQKAEAQRVWLKQRKRRLG